MVPTECQCGGSCFSLYVNRIYICIIYTLRSGEERTKLKSPDEVVWLPGLYLGYLF